VEPQGKVDPRAAGRGLRAIHDALLDYDGPTLPPAGHGSDVAEMLADVPVSADSELLLRLAAHRPHLDGQALHGDAHLGNVLRAGESQYWHDLESTCHGPREYDLAALACLDRLEGHESAARKAIAAYGPHDPELVDTLIPVYAAWVYASFLLATRRRPELARVLAERLDRLRRYTGER
jgi:hypothetical protein